MRLRISFYTTALLLMVLVSAGFAQDLRPTATLKLDSRFSVIMPTYVGQNRMLFHTDVMAQFGQDDWRWHAYAADVFSQQSAFVVGRPDSVDLAAVKHSQEPERRQPLVSEKPIVAVGTSFGQEDWRMYAGAGYDLSGRARIHVAAYWLPVKFLELYGLADVASGNWRYDVRALVKALPDEYLGDVSAGLYLKSRLGVGLMVQMNFNRHLALQYGWGTNPDLKIKQKNTLWLGVQLSY